MRLSLMCFLALMLLLSPTGALASHSVYEEANGFGFFLSTAKDTYVTYEYVPVEFTVTNVSGDTTYFYSPCTDIFMCIGIWDPTTPFHPESEVVWGYGCGCFTEVTTHMLEPMGSYVRASTWDMVIWGTDDLIRRTGTYTIEATFEAYSMPDYEPIGHTLQLEFEVLSGAAAVPDYPSSWGVIKSLFR